MKVVRRTVSRIKENIRFASLLLLVVNVALVACAATTESEPSARPRPTVGQEPADDPKEEALISQIDSATKINGDKSPIVFERWIDLLKYLLRSNSQKLLSKRTQDLKQKFLNLSAGDQSYFSVPLLGMAIECAQKGRKSEANFLCAPVVASGEKMHWQNKGEISLLLSRAAFGLHEQHMTAESEQALQAACQLSDSGTMNNLRAHHDLAALHVETKSLGDAAGDLEKIVQADRQQCDGHDLVRLVKVYETKGDKGKLANLMKWIFVRISATQGERDLSILAPIVSSYSSAGLPDQAKEIAVSLIEHAQYISLTYFYQYDLVNLALYIPTTAKYDKEALPICKSWTDLLKKKCGTHSREWCSAMAYRMTVCSASKNAQAGSEIEQEVNEANLGTGDLGFRMARLNMLGSYRNMLGSFSRRNDEYVLSTLDRLMENVPDERDAPIFLADAADFYKALDKPERSKSCRLKAIDILCGRLTPGDYWLRPYLEKLKVQSPDDTTSNFFRAAVSDIDSGSHSDLETLVFDELQKLGSADSEVLLQEKINRLSVAQTDKWQIQSAMLDYVIQQEGKNNLTRTTAENPNPDLLGQAYCFYLEPFLQAHWKAARTEAAQCELSFLLVPGGVKECRILSKPNQKCDAAALQAIDAIKANASKLPGTVGMRFKADFDARSGVVTVASQDKSGKWYSPPRSHFSKGD